MFPPSIPTASKTTNERNILKRIKAKRIKIQKDNVLLRQQVLELTHESHKLRSSLIQEKKDSNAKIEASRNVYERLVEVSKENQTKKEENERLKQALLDVGPELTRIREEHMILKKHCLEIREENSKLKEEARQAREFLFQKSENEEKSEYKLQPVDLKQTEQLSENPEMCMNIAASNSPNFLEQELRQPKIKPDFPPVDPLGPHKETDERCLVEENRILVENLSEISQILVEKETELREILTTLEETKKEGLDSKKESEDLLQVWKEDQDRIQHLSQKLSQLQTEKEKKMEEARYVRESLTQVRDENQKIKEEVFKIFGEFKKIEAENKNMKEMMETNSQGSEKF
eukprot:TRINITY_DN10899_c0_g1_i3.p1 TRINITY_DN10899_c0_g1~~TRINITY_DN10899_c0_g1_i3.p1  ORF type:complete len:366 (+),score=107.79 TRINITY_DN10899_c0_g1_i3:63-1100(+)